MFKALIGRGHSEFSTMRQQVSIPQYVTVYHSMSQYTTVCHSIPQYTALVLFSRRMHKSSSSTCCQRLRKTSVLPQLLSILLTALSSRCVLASGTQNDSLLLLPSHSTIFSLSNFPPSPSSLSSSSLLSSTSSSSSPLPSPPLPSPPHTHRLRSVYSA